jgi:glycerophosphoryl diester phosphodiesterase
MPRPLDRLDVQGHRGARGLLPENTLPAFSRALEIGVTTLELDCGLTRDGVVVVSHDTALNPEIVRDTRGCWLEGAGPAIWHMTFDEVRRYDVGRLKPGSPYANRFPRQQSVDGTPIPALAELFALVRRAGNTSVRFNIETKLSPLEPGVTAAPEVFVHALLEAIAAADAASRVSIQSFDWRTLQIVQSEAPAIETVYLTAQHVPPHNVSSAAAVSPWSAGFRFSDSIPRVVAAAGGSAWSPPYQELTHAALAEAHALGLRVIAWTVNEDDDMRRLIEWGIDGIISDYPDLLLATAQSTDR